MKEGSPGTVTAPPTVQKMQRLRTIEKEHKDALERAVSLNVPHAVEAAEDDANEREEEEEGEGEPSQNNGKEEDGTSSKSESRAGKLNWDEVVQKLFNKSETGDLRLKREDTSATDSSVPK